MRRVSRRPQLLVHISDGEADSLVDPHGGRCPELYPPPTPADAWMSHRFACKLSELGFRLRGFSQVNVVFTPRLPHGQIQRQHGHVLPWFRTFHVGLSPALYRRLSAAARHDLRVDLIAEVLRQAARRASLSAAAVDVAARELKQQGSTLEILARSHETPLWTVRITFQIWPGGKSSRAFIEYHDKRTGQTGKRLLTRLPVHHAVYFLCRRIHVRDGFIVIDRYGSISAKVFTREWRTPLRIPVSVLVPGKAGSRRGPRSPGPILVAKPRR